jgi:uncharacterized membrane protein
MEERETPRGRPEGSSSRSHHVDNPPLGQMVHEAVREQRRFFSGPLPPPEVLAEYNKVFPDCAKMIVEMAQREQQHRHAIEDRESQAAHTLARRGQLIGGVLAVVAVVGAIYLLAHDKSITGLSVMGAVVATFGGAFVYDRYQRSKLSAQSQDRTADELLPPSRISEIEQGDD